jgi:hypothetical protein
MATSRPTLFLLIVKEILLVHFIITYKISGCTQNMLCTPWLRNPLTIPRLSCLGDNFSLGSSKYDFASAFSTGVFTNNNGPNNVPTQPNKHISQTSRCQLMFLFFNESKTAFIKTIFSCHLSVDLLLIYDECRKKSYAAVRLFYAERYPGS